MNTRLSMVAAVAFLAQNGIKTHRTTLYSKGLLAPFCGGSEAPA
ncbi:MAG: hypothetical protein NTW72_09765 [Gemmatimonadetes bacterium]|nr:hypothetical protein [Gemmatimonadota bacterium]